MKKIDKFIIFSFVGPYILSFFIAEFVLIMQFLWKYIDEILGKGFTIFEILELIIYYGLTIVPMALPISILIASVMVFGNIAERHELSSMKSAGISLVRVMMPGISIAIVTALFSLFSSNYLKPASNFQFKKRFDYIRRQKSNLAIEEGVFNDDFRSFAIRVAEKSKTGIGVKDVLIYDHTLPDKSLVNMIHADSADMYTVENGNYFVMKLKNGYNYQEGDRSGSNGKGGTYPMTRTQFGDWTKVFDMSEFHLSENDISINRNKEDMLNTFQLLDAIDTFKQEMLNMEARLSNDFHEVKNATILSDSAYAKMTRESKSGIAPLDTVEIQLKGQHESNAKSLLNEKYKKSTRINLKRKAIVDKYKNKAEDKKINSGMHQISYANIDTFNNLYEMFDSAAKVMIYPRASTLASTKKDNAANTLNSIKSTAQQREVYLLRLHQQYSFAMICILFMFIGAPLGSIIRKGGYGYPLLVAILFYMMFVISTIFGEKLLKSETLYGVTAAWLPCLVQLPFAIYFTFKALNDAKFTGLEKVERFLTNLVRKPITSDEKK